MTLGHVIELNQNFKLKILFFRMNSKAAIWICKVARQYYQVEIPFWINSKIFEMILVILIYFKLKGSSYPTIFLSKNSNPKNCS